MIVSPKAYDSSNVGGYLCNDVTHSDEMFSDKKLYRDPSVIGNENNIVNDVGSIGFKVNKDLLKFLSTYLGNSLLIQSSEFEAYGNFESLSKYKKGKYKSHKSKLVHQEYILKIADLYKEFNSIYFPVKLDHRGRLYCVPAYFNYQSSDLAKGRFTNFI